MSQVSPTKAALIAIGTFLPIEGMALVGFSSNSEILNNLSSIFGLAAFFVPGLLAGILTSARPFLVGLGTGLGCSLADFSLGTVIFGLEAGLSLFRVDPIQSVWQVVAAVVLVVIGFQIRVLLRERPAT